MSSVTKRRGTVAPPSEIWATLADFGAIGTWATRLDHVEVITPIRTGIGATRRIQVGNFVLLERVVTWDEPSELAYVITGLPERVRSVENRWTITRQTGSTEIALTSTIDAGSRPPQQALAKGFATVLARISDELLDGLVAHLDGGSQ